MIWQPRIRWSHIKSILVGVLAMSLSVIALWVILGAIVATSKREIPVGPIYLLIPVAAFATGCYWSLRRSARPAKPPSNFTIIVKSTVVGILAIILSVIGYLTWFWLRIPRNEPGLVSIDVRALLYWPVLWVSFLGGFILEYRIASRRRSTSPGGVAQ